MNVIFVIDMFICFISAHYDAEFKIVDDFKVRIFKQRFDILYISIRKLLLSTSMVGLFWTLYLSFPLIYSLNMETSGESSDSHVSERYIS